MNLDVNIVVDNLIEQIAELSKQNAILKAQVQIMMEKENEKDGTKKTNV